MQISISNSIGGGGGNLGSGGGSSFTNTKSIELDGVDDFVTMGDVICLSSIYIKWK